MTISLPWFPEGDNTAPILESPMHRLFGDYHQTYDLFATNHTLPFSLFFWERTNNNKIIFPSGKQYLFERYVPFDYIDNQYFLKFSEWIKQWFGITEIINSIPRPPRLELTFPISTQPCNVTYLTLDTTVRGVRVYTLIRESISGDWTPLYPILVNSLTSDSETGWSDIARQYLLAENWVLPTRESVGLIIDESNQIGQSSISVQLTTRQFQTFTEESFSCLNVRNSRYELFYYPRTEEGFNQATAERENFISNPPEWLNSCTYQAISLSNETTTVSVGDIIFFESVFDGVSDAPIPPSEPFYFWGYLRSDADIQPCLSSITTNQVSGDFTSNVDVTYQSVDEPGDRYHYAISANHNYWSKQATLVYADGIEPCVYIAPGIEPSDFIFTLERCLGETISNSVYGTLYTNIDESKTYETFTYVWCNTGETITEERISSETITENSISSLTREPNNPDADLILVPDTIAYADSYWLGNNGMEFNYNMPDSIRVKEVHQALEASRFGSLSSVKVLQRPDGSTQEIQNTLAAQIEYSQEVLAAFNFPARFRSYRQVIEDGESVAQEPILVNNLPELIYSLYSELALSVGPGSTVDQVEGENTPITYVSLQDQVDDVLSNQAVQFGLSGSQSFEIRRVLWQLTQVLIALGVPCEVSELEFPGVGVVPVPRVSPGARTIRQALDDLQVNLTPKV